MKKRDFLYHLLFWSGIYLLWVLLFRSYTIALTRTMTVEFCYLLFITADYYAISYVVVPKLLLRKKYALFVACTVAVIAVSAWLRAILAFQMNLHYFTPARVYDLSTLFVNSIINISLWVLAVTTAKMLIDRMRTQRQLETMEKEKIQNELDYLKAQINPHALFNSLNAIYGHIDKGNQAARDILLQFSELLRYQIYDCSAEKVNLENEIAHLQNYIAFHRLRKDEKLSVRFDIGSIQAGLKIAPLLLVVLIENAFKFVSSFDEKENRIAISLFTRENTLHCSFFNTKDIQEPCTASGSNGIGIINLKRRLELLYPEKYTLTSNAGKEYYETNLILDLS
ncbi:MAG: histidine kinase [Bacteroidota bacterium]|nr:histidine kinase [Bacteroidota bacterium]MDP4244688.1 histidine kinase [Bacteroidota bacterium]MDP4256879.1 histidine kinase [Bacteroidota bacterium]